MEISKETVAKALEVYKPEQRILLEASMDYPLIRGKFLVGQTYYSNIPSKHATDIEIQLCLNQLVYVGVAELLRTGNLLEFKDVDFEKDQVENMLLVESKKRFRRRIRTDKVIEGQIEFKRLKKIGKKVFSRIDFDFENRSCIGSLELVLVR